MKSFPRNGEGLEAFVDSSDTGYTLNDKPVETNGASNGLKKLNVLNDDTSSNGHKEVPVANGKVNGAKTDSVKASNYNASRPEVRSYNFRD